MSSKRAVRRRACAGKVRFANEDAAYRKLRFIYADYPERLDKQHPYRCRFCGGWHLGH